MRGLLVVLIRVLRRSEVDFDRAVDIVPRHSLCPEEDTFTSSCANLEPSWVRWPDVSCKNFGAVEVGREAVQEWYAVLRGDSEEMNFSCRRRRSPLGDERECAGDILTWGDASATKQPIQRSEVLRLHEGLGRRRGRRRNGGRAGATSTAASDEDAENGDDEE